MEETFEVELDYGTDGPADGEPSPTEDDIAASVSAGLEARGFPSVDVRAKRL